MVVITRKRNRRESEKVSLRYPYLGAMTNAGAKVVRHIHGGISTTTRVELSRTGRRPGQGEG